MSFKSTFQKYIGKYLLTFFLLTVDIDCIFHLKRKKKYRNKGMKQQKRHETAKCRNIMFNLTKSKTFGKNDDKYTYTLWWLWYW